MSFFKWFDWCQFYPSWQQQWGGGVTGLLIKSILGFFFNFSSSSRLIGRWECDYVILFLSLVLPSLFYPISLHHFCPCSLHGLALSCLRADHLNERELLMFANKPFLRFSRFWKWRGLWLASDECSFEMLCLLYFLWFHCVPFLLIINTSHCSSCILTRIPTPTNPPKNADWLLLVFVVSTGLGIMKTQIRLHRPWPLVC